VRNVRAVRRRACCSIAIGGCRRLRPIDLRQLRGLLRYDVDVLELRTQNRNSIEATTVGITAAVA
jgi:hypothetical protein